MSVIQFCPNGGQSGVMVTEQELEEFSKKMGSSFDAIIPLPGLMAEQQLHRRKECIHTEHGSQYFEVKDTEIHGWCCNHCGTTTQWG